MRKLNIERKLNSLFPFLNEIENRKHIETNQTLYNFNQLCIKLNLTKEKISLTHEKVLLEEMIWIEEKNWQRYYVSELGVILLIMYSGRRKYIDEIYLWFTNELENKISYQKQNKKQNKKITLPKSYSKYRAKRLPYFLNNQSYVIVSELYDDYVNYCNQNNYDIVNKNLFGKLNRAFSNDLLGDVVNKYVNGKYHRCLKVIPQ